MKRVCFTSWVDKANFKQVELIYAGYLPRWRRFKKLILNLFSQYHFSGGFMMIL